MSALGANGLIRSKLAIATQRYMLSLLKVVVATARCYVQNVQKLTRKRVKPRHLTGCGVFVITASFPNMNIWVFIEFRLNICLIIWSCSKGSGLSIHMPRVQNH